MHAEWSYDAGEFEYQSSSEEKRQDYRRNKSPKLNRKKPKTKTTPAGGINRRRNKHWSW
jgi:hypothetical protein